MTPRRTRGVAWYLRPGPPGLDDPPLILLHSLGHSAKMWSPQLEALAARRPIITVDTRGHGRSFCSPGQCTLQDLAQDVLAIADEAAMERFDLCGLSLGGQMALWIAAHHPARVRRLIVCASAARVGDRAGWDARIAQVRAGGMAAIEEVAIARFFSNGFMQRAPRVVEAARAQLRATDPQGYIRCCEALREVDLTEVLPRIEAPTLLLAGAADVSTPPSALRSLQSRIPGARLSVIPKAAHLLNLEAPQAVTEAIEAHLLKRSL